MTTDTALGVTKLVVEDKGMQLHPKILSCLIRHPSSIIQDPV